MEQMDSAERDEGAEWDDSAASACAACVGDDGSDPGAPEGESSRCRLIDSAWRLGGPLRRLGLSKVHGISSAEQALHGGPASSHCEESVISHSHQLRCPYLHFPYATRVARFAQAINFVRCLLLRLPIGMLRRSALILNRARLLLRMMRRKWLLVLKLLDPRLYLARSVRIESQVTFNLWIS